MSQLLRFNKKQKYILFDVESESLALLHPLNKPFQLSYLICEGDQIVKESDNYIFWADLNMSEEAARVTKFDYLKYKRLAKDPLPILTEFEKYLYDPEYLVLGQNILGFDVAVHNIYRQILGFKSDWSYINRIIDTNALAKAIEKGIKYQKTDNFTCWMHKLNDYREKGLKTSIKTLLKKYKIEYDENMLHSSIYDVKMNWEIFKKQIWEIEI